MRAPWFWFKHRIAGNGLLAMKGIRRKPNLTDTTAPLPAEVRRESEAPATAAFRSEDIKEAQLAFMKERKHTSSAASARQSPLSRPS